MTNVNPVAVDESPLNDGAMPPVIAAPESTAETVVEPDLDTCTVTADVPPRDSPETVTVLPERDTVAPLEAESTYVEPES